MPVAQEVKIALFLCNADELALARKMDFGLGQKLRRSMMNILERKKRLQSHVEADRSSERSRQNQNGWSNICSGVDGRFSTKKMESGVQKLIDNRPREVTDQEQFALEANGNAQIQARRVRKQGDEYTHAIAPFPLGMDPVIREI